MFNNNDEKRWRQRYSNYQKALDKLSEAIQLYQTSLDKPIDENFIEVLKEGLIQRFEYTHELAWNVMKDFLSEKGVNQIYGSKDATKEAFKTDLIQNGEIWFQMIQSRNKTSHTYNQEVANDIFEHIIEFYHDELLNFAETMSSK